MSYGMTARESAALDRYITGNYGEDQFKGASGYQCIYCGDPLLGPNDVTALCAMRGDGDSLPCVPSEEYEVPDPIQIVVDILNGSDIVWTRYGSETVTELARKIVAALGA